MSGECENCWEHCLDCECRILKMNWICVEERLPIEGIKVLSYQSFNEEIQVDYIVYAPDPIWACTLDREQNNVTHWMLLPEKPSK